jgi:hypothetical protein
MAVFKDFEVTQHFLDSNSNAYFIFGDNVERRGYWGTSKLRDHPHALGFIIKKFPDNRDTSFYHVEEYLEVFFEELQKLVRIVKSRADKTFYISKLGDGLANRYQIYEFLIEPNLIQHLKDFDNVVFCWKESLVSKLS